MNGQRRHDRDFFDPLRRRSLGSAHLRGPLVNLFRRVIWHRLPRPLRRLFLEVLFARLRTSVATNAPAVEPICVAGLLSTPTGIGEGGRLCGRALSALGYDVLSVDLSTVLAHEGDRNPAPPLECGGGTVILHFNPDNLSSILTLLGRRRLRGKRIIGYWAWELPKIPQHWLPALHEVDEVWTPSTFVAEAVRPCTSKPVHVVPHPVAQASAGVGRRPQFGIADQFVVLSMFSFASSYARKNPRAAVEAFRRAFGDAEDKLMILKVSDADERPEEMADLLSAVAAAPNIRILDRRLSDQERLDLIASSDVLLSLHRSEGFGLIMAEAMLAGTLVVATAWSGNLEFMDSDTALLVPYRLVPAADAHGVYGDGENWADPDVGAAAAHLVRAAACPTDLEDVRRAARELVAQRLGLGGFETAVAKSLDAPGRRREIPVRAAGPLADLQAARV